MFVVYLEVLPCIRVCLFAFSTLLPSTLLPLLLTLSDLTYHKVKDHNVFFLRFLICFFPFPLLFDLCSFEQRPSGKK